MFHSFKVLETSLRLDEQNCTKNNACAHLRARIQRFKMGKIAFSTLFRANNQNILARSARGNARALKISASSCEPETLDAFAPRMNVVQYTVK